jgi:hypothetical protein
VRGLEAEFGEQVDFIDIDWDIEAGGDLAAEFGVFSRTTYVFVGPDGEAVQRWLGPISQDEIAAVIAAQLANFE